MPSPNPARKRVPYSGVRYLIFPADLVDEPAWMIWDIAIQCGAFYERCEIELGDFSHVVYCESQEMCLTIAESAGRIVDVELVNDDVVKLKVRRQRKI